MNKISNFLQSPANWGGIGLSTLALVLSSLGLTQVGAGALAVLGYAAGFGVGGMWFGFPNFSGTPWDALKFEDQGDARTSMLTALNAVRQLVDHNPQNRLPASLQAKVLELCKQLNSLLDRYVGRTQRQGPATQRRPGHTRRTGVFEPFAVSARKVQSAPDRVSVKILI